MSHGKAILALESCLQRSDTCASFGFSGPEGFKKQRSIVVRLLLQFVDFLQQARKIAASVDKGILPVMVSLPWIGTVCQQDFEIGGSCPPGCLH